MSKAESFFIWLIIGPVIPVLLFLIFWWTSIGLVSDQSVFLVGLVGLGIGCFIDIFLLRQKISEAYTWSPRILAAIYIFYSVCVFGFFMGVPVFNIAVGIVAGIFMGRSFKHSGKSKEDFAKGSFRVSVFSAVIMGGICLASAYFATKDITDTALNLKGMFKLSFLPTGNMIIALIVFGGLGLIILEYWLTKRAVQWSNRIGT